MDNLPHGSTGTDASKKTKPWLVRDEKVYGYCAIAVRNPIDYVVSLISLQATEIIDVAPVCRILSWQLMP